MVEREVTFDAALVRGVFLPMRTMFVDSMQGSFDLQLGLDTTNQQPRLDPLVYQNYAKLCDSEISGRAGSTKATRIISQDEHATAPPCIHPPKNKMITALLPYSMPASSRFCTTTCDRSDL